MKIKKKVRARLASIYARLFPSMANTRNTAAPITLHSLLLRYLLKLNKSAYWPTHFTSTVLCGNNIEIGVGTAPGLSPNCYIQGLCGIKIGNYTLIGPSVGIISSNHDIYDIHKHQPSKGVVIGEYCWIGMNATILPNVRIGDHTIIAAGSVVTKSFPDGCCVIGGNPAKVIKHLSRDKIKKHINSHQYVGFMSLASSKLNLTGNILNIKYDSKSDSFLPCS